MDVPISGIARILPRGVQILNFYIKFPKFMEISNLTRKFRKKQLWLGCYRWPIATPVATPMVPILSMFLRSIFTVASVCNTGETGDI